MAVAKYKDSNGNIKTLSNVNINLLNNIDDKVLVGGENVLLSSNSDSSIDGKTRALIKKDSPVHFNAITIEGKVFNYMINSQGEIVSYWSKYEMPAYCDEFVKAIYSDNEIEKKSLINWIGKGYDINKELTTIYFYITCDILETEEKLNWHILLSTKGLSDEEMIPETTGIENFEINYGSTNKYTSVKFGLKSSSMFTKHSTVKARAYATISKDGVEEIIYSKVIRFQL